MTSIGKVFLGGRADEEVREGPWGRCFWAHIGMKRSTAVNASTWAKSRLAAEDMANTKPSGRNRLRGFEEQKGLSSWNIMNRGEYGLRWGWRRGPGWRQAGPSEPHGLTLTSLLPPSSSPDSHCYLTWALPDPGPSSVPLIPSGMASPGGILKVDGTSPSFKGKKKETFHWSQQKTD